MRDLWFYLLQGDEKYVYLICFKCFLAVLCENKMIFIPDYHNNFRFLDSLFLLLICKSLFIAFIRPVGNIFAVFINKFSRCQN